MADLPTVLDQGRSPVSLANASRAGLVARWRHLVGAVRAGGGTGPVLGGGFVLLVVAELVVQTGGLALGELCHVAALAYLLGGYVLWSREPERRLLLALSLLPLVRLLSLSLPTRLVPVLDWYVLIGVPSMLALGLAARELGLRPADLGLRLAPIRPELRVAAAGLALSLPAYAILRPQPLVGDPTASGLIVAGAIVAIFGGLFEELLFRGFIQTVAVQGLARGGVIVSTAATALMYAASLDLRYTIFASLVGAFFGLAVRRSGSIVGASAGHALLFYGQLVVWPLALR